MRAPGMSITIRPETDERAQHPAAVPEMRGVGQQRPLWVESGRSLCHVNRVSWTPAVILGAIGLGIVGAIATCIAASATRRKTGWGETRSLFLGWLAWALCTAVITWVLFSITDAAAARAGSRNVGIPVVFFGVWLLCGIIGPVPLFVARFWRAFRLP